MRIYAIILALAACAVAAPADTPTSLRQAVRDAKAAAAITTTQSRFAGQCVERIYANFDLPPSPGIIVFMQDQVKAAEQASQAAAQAYDRVEHLESQEFSSDTRDDRRLMYDMKQKLYSASYLKDSAQESAKNAKEAFFEFMRGIGKGEPKPSVDTGMSGRSDGASSGSKSVVTGMNNDRAATSDVKPPVNPAAKKNPKTESAAKLVVVPAAQQPRTESTTNPSQTPITNDQSTSATTFPLDPSSIDISNNDRKSMITIMKENPGRTALGAAFTLASMASIYAFLAHRRRRAAMNSTAETSSSTTVVPSSISAPDNATTL